MRMPTAFDRENQKMEYMKFRKSTRCEELNQTGCIEVAKGPGVVVAIRDSKDQKGPIILMSDVEWHNFIRAIQGS
ncbi:DUF397 domain-containing protein [Spirillospora sp. NPDC000708]